jgi:hypothetical protein
MFSETLRSRWFSTALHAGLWALLLLALIGAGIGRQGVRYGEAEADPAGVVTPAPVAPLQRLFSTAWPKSLVDASSRNLFATTHFFVPPPPPPPPAPPPPTTRKIELTYQGFYRVSNGPKHALMRLGGALLDIPVGGRVVTNLFVLEADMQILTLTNSAGQTNALQLNANKTVEVPLQ